MGCLSRTKALQLVLVIFGLVLGGDRNVWAQDTGVLENRLRAAFMFNFARFTEWPAEPAQSGFDLCVHAPAPLAELISNELQGKQVRGETVRVRRVVQPEAVTSCRVLYFKSADEGLSEGWINALTSQPILLVGEGRSFLQAGGMVGFFLSEGRLRFAINPARVRAGGLTMSSRLLGLAEITGGNG